MEATPGEDSRLRASSVWLAASMVMWDATVSEAIVDVSRTQNAKSETALTNLNNSFFPSRLDA